MRPETGELEGASIKDESLHCCQDTPGWGREKERIRKSCQERTLGRVPATLWLQPPPPGLGLQVLLALMWPCPSPQGSDHTGFAASHSCGGLGKADSNRDTGPNRKDVKVKVKCCLCKFTGHLLLQDPCDTLFRVPRPPLPCFPGLSNTRTWRSRGTKFLFFFLSFFFLMHSEVRSFPRLKHDRGLFPPSITKNN